MASELNNLAVDDFAAEILRLAGDRKLLSRIDVAAIRQRIKRLRNYSSAIVDPGLMARLSEKLSLWSESKNLFIVLTVVEGIHIENLAALSDEEPSDAESEEESEEGQEEEDEGEEAGMNKAQGNIRRIRDLIADYLGLDRIARFMEAHPPLGAIYRAWIGAGAVTRRYLFKIRHFVTAKKRWVDDFAFEIAKKLMSRPTDNPLVLMALFAVWLVLSILSIALGVLLFVLRPGKFLELFGLDDGVLPLGD